MMATNGGQAAIAELLVTMGADITVKDKVPKFFTFECVKHK